jgi:hypothetical protein
MKTTTFFFTILLSLGVQAQNSIRINRVDYGGNGCPSGSASPIVSPDQSEFQMLFDSFTADSTRLTNQLDVRNCNILISMKIPSGYQVALITDIEGFAHVQSGSKAQLREEIVLDNQRLPLLTKDFSLISNNFQMSSDQLLGTRPIWSKCGENSVARIGFQLKATGRQQAILNLDNLKLRYQWRRCH